MTLCRIQQADSELADQAILEISELASDLPAADIDGRAILLAAQDAVVLKCVATFVAKGGGSHGLALQGIEEQAPERQFQGR
jgi:hypothetical protein